MLKLGFGLDFWRRPCQWYWYGRYVFHHGIFQLYMLLLLHYYSVHKYKMQQKCKTTT